MYVQYFILECIIIVSFQPTAACFPGPYIGFWPAPPAHHVPAMAVVVFGATASAVLYNK